jgi:hypothetical protein
LLTSKLLQLERTSPFLQSTVSLPSGSQSRRWLWILIVFISFLLVGFIGYFGLKQILLSLHRHSSDRDNSRLSNRHDSHATIVSNMTTLDPSTKQINTSIDPHNQYDNSPDSPSRVKVRSQHLRLGPLDENDV